MPSISLALLILNSNLKYILHISAGIYTKLIFFYRMYGPIYYWNVDTNIRFFFYLFSFLKFHNQYYLINLPWCLYLDVFILATNLSIAFKFYHDLLIGKTTLHCKLSPSYLSYGEGISTKNWFSIGSILCQLESTQKVHL